MQGQGKRAAGDGERSWRETASTERVQTRTPKGTARYLYLVAFDGFTGEKP